jgi:predicted ferric reductase
MVNRRLSSITIRKSLLPLLVLVILLIIVCQIYPEDQPLWQNIALLSGWAGSGLLAASMLLMIREPHIAKLLGGLENMYLWHHRSGMLAYVLLLCHPLSLALNGWTTSPQLAWQSFIPWAQPWQVGLGWISLLLLMFGLSSTFVVNLPYRRWRGMHLFLGFGVLLGLVHGYLIAGGILILLLIFFTILGLGWRFIASDFGVAASPYLVTQVTKHTSGLIEASLVPRANTLHVAPGQFVLSAFGKGPHFLGCGEYHPFTVSSIENDGSLKLSIKALGPCSNHLQELEAGVQVRLQGPFGTFLDESTSTPQLWVAGGIGITPFIAALRAHPCTHPTTLLYLFRHEAEAAFLEELYMLRKTDPMLEIQTHASDNGLPDFPALLDKVGKIETREVFICGPKPMLDSLMPCLLQRKIPEAAIHYEKFDFR